MMTRIFFIILFLATSPVNAATYYVDCNKGNNTNSGASHAQAWKTVSKVNVSVSTSGDDVYFLAGCAWRDQLVIDWGGTEGNRAVVGSYYMNGGKETIGVSSVPKDPENPGIYDSKKPTFVGTCVDKANCPFNTNSSIPTNEWQAMVAIEGNYTTVQDLKINNSSGRGIDVIGKVSKNQRYNNNYIINNTVEHTLRSGIFLNRSSHTNTIRGNTVTKAAVIYPYGWHKNWPAAISMGRSDYNVIEQNYIYNTFGEGIGIYSKSDFNIVRNNIVIKGSKPGIYVSCSDNNIIENNKVLGDRKGDFVRIKNNYPNVQAYGSTSETYCKADTKNNIFRNNLAANVKNCFVNSIEKGAARKGYKVINEYYKNTCINAYQGFVNISNGADGNAYAIFTHNIITKVDRHCGRVDSGSKVNFNHWDAMPANVNCRGANDIYGDPGLNVLQSSKVKP